MNLRHISVFLCAILIRYQFLVTSSGVAAIRDGLEIGLGMMASRCLGYGSDQGRDLGV